MPPKIPQPEPEPEPEVSLGGNTNKKTDKPKDDLSHGAFRDAASIASISLRASGVSMPPQMRRTPSSR